MNGYFPVSGAKKLGERDTGLSIDRPSASIYLNRTQHQLVPMGGFDAEFGYNSANNPLKLYLAYYYFSGNKVKTIQGPRLRTSIQLHDCFSITGEVQHDAVRKTSYFAGFNLSYLFDKKASNSHWSYTKMSQLPERDIDVVTGDVRVDTKIRLDGRDKLVVVPDYAKFVAETSAVGSDTKIFVLTHDISAPADSLHTPIGNEDNPFQGILFGGIEESNDSYTLEMRTINLSNIDSHAKEIGLFGVIKNADISHIQVNHTPWNITVANDASIGSLAGSIYSSNITNVICRGDINVEGDGYGTIGGIVGTADNNNQINLNQNFVNITAKLAGSEIGGVVGYVDDESSVIANINHGIIRAEGNENQVAGIIGYAGGDIHINNNSNMGEIVGSGNEIKIAGIVGEVGSSNFINNNSNMGEIVGSGNQIEIAGIVALINNENRIEGNQNTAKISGEKSAGAYVSGIVGNAANKNYIFGNSNTGKIFGGKSSSNRISSIAGVVGFARNRNKIINNNNEGYIYGASKGGNLSGIVGSVDSKNQILHNWNVGEMIKSDGALQGDFFSLGIIESANANNVIKYNYTKGIMFYDEKNNNTMQDVRLNEVSLNISENYLKDAPAMDVVNLFNEYKNNHEHNDKILPSVIQSLIDTGNIDTLDAIKKSHQKEFEAAVNKINQGAFVNSLLKLNDNHRQELKRYMKQFTKGLGRIRGDGVLLTLAQMFDGKDVNVTGLTTKFTYRDYLNSLKDSGKTSHREKYILATGGIGTHWENGEIFIDENGAATLLHMDSTQNMEKFSSICTKEFLEIFGTKAKMVYIAGMKVQRSHAGCSTFALDAIHHLTNANTYLADKYSKTGLLGYLQEHSTIIKKDHLSKALILSYNTLPLPFMGTMQSRGIFKYVTNATSEEQAIVINQQGQTISQSINSLFAINANGNGQNIKAEFVLQNMAQRNLQYLASKPLSESKNDMDRFTLDAFKQRMKATSASDSNTSNGYYCQMI